MDEIIQIVIFIAAMGVSLWIQQKTKTNKNSKTTTPKEVLEEMFPEIEEYQETKTVQPIFVNQPVYKKKNSFHSKPKTNKPSTNSTIHYTKKASKSTKNICLKTKEEARKAFIYSEIFNRKY